MDKKDFKYFIKQVTKIWVLMIIVIGVPSLIIFSLISFIFNGDMLKNIIPNILSMIFAACVLLMIIYLVIGMIFLFARIRRKNDTIVASSYIRDLPECFPPAIASFLLDLSIEVTTDYTATIAYLVSKKYIKLDAEEIKVLNSEVDGLSGHEQYVFDCITKKINLVNDEFIKLIMEDALSMGLIEEGRRKIHFFRNFLISLVIFFTCAIIVDMIDTGIIYSIFSIIGFLSEISIFAVIGYSIYLSVKYQNESFHRTKYGKVETLKWSGLKKYFRDFTLVSEKNLSDVILLDDYIPYAIALNEAKSIEKYIENSDAYRKLIYGRIYNFDNNIKKKQ